MGKVKNFFHDEIVARAESDESFGPDYSYGMEPEKPLDTPSIDTSFHDHEMDVDDPEPKYQCPHCDGEDFRVLISTTASMDGAGAIECDNDSEPTVLFEHGVLCSSCDETFLIGDNKCLTSTP